MGYQNNKIKHTQKDTLYIVCFANKELVYLKLPLFEQIHCYVTGIKLQSQSSQWTPVLLLKISKTLFGPVIFQFFFKKYKNAFKNLIGTSKLKCSFRGLQSEYLETYMLTHWNNSPWLDMSLHMDTLSWLRANQSLLFTT